MTRWWRHISGIAVLARQAFVEPLPTKKGESFMIRLPGLACALILCGTFISAAQGANITVLTCSPCTTTVNFTSAAQNQSLFDQMNRLYVMQSTSDAKTAYIRVTGAWTHTQEPMWYVTSVQPVDVNGVTLASQGYC